MSTVDSDSYGILTRTEVKHRVFYVAKLDEAVPALHVFQKKAQKTAQHDLAIGRRYYQALQQWRRTAREGNGTVFLALGFPPAEAENLRV